MDIDLFGWIVIAASAAVVGMSKTGVPGLGILPVPLMALAFPSRESTGLLLGLLILADLFAVTYHRRNARWHLVLRLLPAALAGIVAGYFGMQVISDQHFKPIIGGIVLVMLGLNYWRTRAGGGEAPVPTQWWFAIGLGFMAGVTTMIANAAGPVMIIYLLAMRLPKIEFVGTSVWFFFVVNWLKVPFSVKLDLMTVDSLKLDVMMLPCIALGAVAGIFFLKRIPQKAFTAIVQILAAAAAIKLLF
ncbi:MAG: hypothetical protein A2Z25_24270 [Planctomycetes bacterium RBG_16_55_9]|nr:MAG: hypothetical protein A2Z25_24270 [Planctomycetes bacterium RBG_16_55_9]